MHGNYRSIPRSSERRINARCTAAVLLQREIGKLLYAGRARLRCRSNGRKQRESRHIAAHPGIVVTAATTQDQPESAATLRTCSAPPDHPGSTFRVGDSHAAALISLAADLPSKLGTRCWQGQASVPATAHRPSDPGCARFHEIAENLPRPAPARTPCDRWLSAEPLGGRLVQAASVASSIACARPIQGRPTQVRSMPRPANVSEGAEPRAAGSRDRAGPAVGGHLPAKVRPGD